MVVIVFTRPHALAYVICLYKNQIYYGFIDLLNQKDIIDFLSQNYLKILPYSVVLLVMCLWGNWRLV